MDVTFGDTTLSVVNGDEGQFHLRAIASDYRSDIDQTWWVDIIGQFDPATRVITWTFLTLDPTTGDLPLNALAGFLPPNDASGRGEGHVTFSIDPVANINLGTQIKNQAAIVFDTNAPIITNQVSNTIDQVPDPAVRVFLPVVVKGVVSETEQVTNGEERLFLPVISQ